MVYDPNYDFVRNTDTQHYSKSEVKLKKTSYVSIEKYEALEAKLARLVEAVKDMDMDEIPFFTTPSHSQKVLKLKAAVEAAKVKP